MANKRTIQEIMWTLLVGGTLVTAELLLMGPIVGPISALSTFGGIMWCIMVILLPDPIDEAAFNTRAGL